MSQLQFTNFTELDTQRTGEILASGMHGWATGSLIVRVRYSRGADFSGACYYADQRIFINLGRHVQYVYRMTTHLARTRTVGRRWYRPLYTIELSSPYELVAFIFMHELYHLLVKRAGRNVRQKEGRCDRFAARFVVDHFGARVLSETGSPLSRAEWDVQDVEGFVESARDRRVRPESRSPAATTRGVAVLPPPESRGQMLLFA